MALVKPTATTQTTIPAGQFEGMSDEGKSADTAPFDTAPQVDRTVQAAAAETIAPPAASDIVVDRAPVNGAIVESHRSKGAEFKAKVEAMRGAADFAHGNYTVFKGNNGEIMQTGTGGAKLGRWTKVSMIAWDNHYEVSPGSDDKASRDAVGYSKDGVVIDSIIGEEFRNWVGRKCVDYVKFLQADTGYPKAKLGEFIDVACVVHEAESNEDFNGEIIQITLSQSSIGSFGKYQERLVQKARAVEMGVPGVKLPTDPFTFYFLREAAEKNGKNWTKLAVVDKLPAKI